MGKVRIPTGRVAATATIGAVAILLAGVAFGGPGVAVSAPLAFLCAAIRHDNDLGTCFPLALLFLIIIAVLLLLLMMLSMIGAR